MFFNLFVAFYSSIFKRIFYFIKNTKLFSPNFFMRSIFSLISLYKFDHLFKSGERYQIGGLDCMALHTPGHTPACTTHLIGDAAFVGDTIFMPKGGTARADFPGGSAGQLYDSIQKIFELPADTRLFMCHDYKAPGRDVYAWETSVARWKMARRRRVAATIAGGKRH